MVESLASDTSIIIVTLVLFFVAALMEIGGAIWYGNGLERRKEFLWD